MLLDAAEDAADVVDAVLKVQSNRLRVCKVTIDISWYLKWDRRFVRGRKMLGMRYNGGLVRFVYLEILE